MFNLIHGKKRVLLVPADVLNALISFIGHFKSPNGTIRINGIADDSDMRPEIDIDPKKTAIAMKEELTKDFVCEGRGNLLGPGLKWSENGLTIDREWLQGQIVNLLH